MYKDNQHIYIYIVWVCLGVCDRSALYLYNNRKTKQKTRTCVITKFINIVHVTLIHMPKRKYFQMSSAGG